MKHNRWSPVSWRRRETWPAPSTGFASGSSRTASPGTPRRRARCGDPDPFAWRALPAGAPFRAAMEDYLDRYGHRAVFEMELASVRWAEDPRYVLDQVRFHLDHTAGTRCAVARRRPATAGGN